MDSSERRHLLLLWRDAAVGAALGRELREYGYSVHTASDLASARAILRGQPIDLVLCEDSESFLAELLPTLAGGATLIALAAGAMSPTQSREAAAAALRAGAYDYLPAPQRPADIMFALSKAAAREAARPDALIAATAARFLPATAPSVATAPSAQGEPAPAAQAAGVPGMLVVSSGMVSLLSKLRRVAAHSTTVLLTGESGTGKEVLARALHGYSPRRAGPFCAVNCGALPETLLESLLFGHRRGAFTDAVRDQRGLLLDADGGTLFLDEIAELSPHLQVKLLRVLQSHRDPENPSAPPYQLVQPLGAEAHEAVRVDVRIVAATLRDLEEEVAAGRFRQDLYYRLSVVPLHVPALRERKDDILPLAQLFLRRTALRLRRPLAGFTAAAQAALIGQSWPGNVRQLENTIERAAVLAEPGTTVLDAADLPLALGATRDSTRDSTGEGDWTHALGLADDDLSLKRAQERLETLLIRRALRRTRGNRSAAARLLELSPRALLYKLREYRLDGPNDGQLAGKLAGKLDRGGEPAGRKLAESLGPNTTAGDPGSARGAAKSRRARRSRAED